MDCRGWITRGRVSHKPGLGFCVVEFTVREGGTGPESRFGVYELRRGAISGARLVDCPTRRCAQQLAEQLSRAS